jgi:hypothetical protein
MHSISPAGSQRAVEKALPIGGATLLNAAGPGAGAAMSRLVHAPAR